MLGIDKQYFVRRRAIPTICASVSEPFLEHDVIEKTPSGAARLQAQSLPKYERGGGARTTPLIVSSVGPTSFITGYTEFDPGVEIPFHSHNCEESVVLMEGEAILDIDGREYPLQAHDVTYIPPNVPHRFRNPSSSAGMKILWIYADPAATRTLVDTGATRLVVAEHDATEAAPISLT
jgi:quercetin dioxygenase-like cupin family protein